MMPEILRRFWTDFTPTRVLLPIIIIDLLIIAIFAQNLGHDDEGLYSLGRAVLIIGGVFGFMQAMRCVSDDEAARIWDFQRSSSLTAVELLAGKLLGSTLYSWYIFALGLLVVAGASYRTVQASIDTRGLLLIFVTFVALQIFGLLASIQQAYRLRIHKDARRIGSVFTGVTLVILVPVIFSTPVLSVYQSPKRPPLNGEILWFMDTYSAIPFIIVSILIFGGWALVGAYRAMRREMSIKNFPIVWPAFLIFISLYCAGFIPNASRWEAITLCGIAFSLTTAYLFLFQEVLTLPQYRQIVRAVASRSLVSAYGKLPLSAVSFLTGLVFWVVYCSTWHANISPFNGIEFSSLSLMNYFLLFLRDALLVIFCSLHFSKKGKGELLAFVIITLLYTLLPFTVVAVFGSPTLAIFVPSGKLHPLTTSTSIVFQLIALSYMTQRAWRANLEIVNRATSPVA